MGTYNLKTSPDLRDMMEAFFSCPLWSGIADGTEKHLPPLMDGQSLKDYITIWRKHYEAMSDAGQNACGKCEVHHSYHAGVEQKGVSYCDIMIGICAMVERDPRYTLKQTLERYIEIHEACEEPYHKLNPECIACELGRAVTVNRGHDEIDIVMCRTFSRYSPRPGVEDDDLILPGLHGLVHYRQRETNRFGRDMA